MSRCRYDAFVALLVIIATIAGCIPSPAPIPTPTQTSEPATVVVSSQTPLPESPANLSEGILFSELVPGVPGDNNYEFVELYNAGADPVDLKGWSLWYQMVDNQEEKRLHFWGKPADIPGNGHFLLVRYGEDIGVAPDATFDVPIFERRGGLQLRDAQGKVRDTLGWGEGGPTDFVNDVPAPAPEGGASLERKPGGGAGHQQDTDDSMADFVLRSIPLPQNSGMDPTPMRDLNLLVSASAPASITPGTPFGITFTVENSTQEDLSLLSVVVPLPDGVGLVQDESDQGAFSEMAGGSTGQVVWTLPLLAAGETSTAELLLRSPWRYGMLYLKGYYVAAEAWPLRDYGPFVPVAIEGGAIPIATARTLVGNIVTVEGIATMYTGGFFAGSTGTKFYLDDGTGGIQAYCPGAQGIVSVHIGDRVRVTGKIELYRDSMEIVPGTYPDDVEVLSSDGGSPEPVVTSVYAATHDVSVPGRLIEVEGTISRLEEFSYSYEADILDDSGDSVLAYIDKESNFSPEFIDVGDRYRVRGISEVYDGQWQLKPRLADDFTRIYPPELMLDIVAPISVAPTGFVTYTLTAHNHTTAPLTDVRITAVVPTASVTVVATSVDPVSSTDSQLTWAFPEILPGGGSAAISYTVQVRPDVAQGSFEALAQASAVEWSEPVSTQPWLTFVGTGVPIWAIQGEGKRSPFVRSQATTDGVVMGVFPELGGFWMQSLEPDDDPATSEGLFVLADELELTMSVGDYVKVSGKVRELSNQTLLHVQDVADIDVVTGTFELPTPIELDPPQSEGEASAYYEALEGMLVAVTEPAPVVGPTSQYGETALVRAEWGVERVMKGEPKGMLIFVDDGSNVTHLDRSTLPFAAKTGDRVGDLLGPLAFTYDAFKIQPIITPTVVTREVLLPALKPAGPGTFSVATLNVENLFDIFDPHPSSPERPSLAAYNLRLEKVAVTVEAMGAPTIVGLQEVENIGILEDLVAQPLIADYGYVPALLEGFDSRGIDVGYLVRGDLATVEGVGQYDAPEGLTSRPPLMITVTVKLDGGDQTVYVINNHFLSMSGGELPTEPRRVAQAAWNAGLVEQLAARDPDAQVIVLGDLNSFYDSPPIDMLREAGLHHVYEFVAPVTPYTYIYQGESETLDHILVTPSLYEHLEHVDVLHTNADFPLAAPDDVSPEHVSDHDPLVAVFTWEE